MPTPFTGDGRIDSDAFEQLLRTPDRGRAPTALVVCGTTGEAPTLSRRNMASWSGIAVRGRARPGAGDRRRRLERAPPTRSRSARTPKRPVPMRSSRSCPTTTSRRRRGLEAHFRAIARSDRTCRHPRRRALPHGIDGPRRRNGRAPGRACRASSVSRTRPATSRGRRVYGRWVGPDFRLMSGDDATAPAFIAQGGDGCISVTSNIAPGLARSLYLRRRQGARAQALADLIAAAHRRAVTRDQSGAGEIRAEPARPDVGQGAPAAGRADPGDPARDPGGAGARRGVQLGLPGCRCAPPCGRPPRGRRIAYRRRRPPALPTCRLRRQVGRPAEPAAMQGLRTVLMRRGFVVEFGTVREDGYAVSARRSETRPISKAA